MTLCDNIVSFIEQGLVTNIIHIEVNYSTK